MVDNVSNTEQDLTAGDVYSFTSDASTTTSRFSVMLKSASLTTGVSSISEPNISIFSNKGQIVVKVKGLSNEAGSVVVTNLLGQNVLNSSISGETTALSLNQGVEIYLVTVKLKGKKITQKVVLNQIP